MRELNDVIVERLEVMPPLITNPYAAATIVSEIFHCRIGATFDDTEPNWIKWIMCHAMPCVSLDIKIGHKTAARLSMTAAQIGKCNSGGIAAITPAQPNNAFVSSLDRAKRNQPAKSLICNIFGMGSESDKLGLHKKFPFLCQAAGHFAMSLRQLYWGHYSFILAQVGE
jgi:hypothetical protein